MANIASKNVFDVLGNDADEGSEAENTAPTRAVEKSLPRTSKRNAPDAPPSGPRAGAGDRGGRGGGRGDYGRGEKNALDPADRFKPKDDGLRADRHVKVIQGGHQNWSPDSRGARGSRGGRGGRVVRDDRHSHMGRTDTDKEVSQGWGSPRGDAEWRDEQAGEAIAQADEKEAVLDAAPAEPVDAEGHHPGEKNNQDEPAAEPEEEDNTRSYADYLAEQAAKRLELGTPEARRPNENAKQDKKWAQAKELKRDEDEDAFIAGSGPKSKRDRQRKEKTFLEIEQRPMEPPRERGRGGRGRGEGRGDFRGDFRGGRGRGGRGEGRGEGRGGYRARGGAGGRGGHGEPADPDDTTAFPSLGGS